jgi:membrane-associated phospholipid phosphatase
MAGPRVVGGPAMNTPQAVARRITDWLEPKNWVIAVIALVAMHADGTAGIGWGLLAIMVAVGLPTAFFRSGLRKGRWSDRHVAIRRQRLPLMVFVIACVGGSLTILAAAGAPRPVLAVIAAVMVTATVLTAITAAWKVSVHCATSSGAVIVLALTFGPLLLACYLLVAAVGWSRLALLDHTLAQVLVGVLLGAGISAVTYLCVQ